MAINSWTPCVAPVCWKCRCKRAIYWVLAPLLLIDQPHYTHITCYLQSCTCTGEHTTTRISIYMWSNVTEDRLLYSIHVITNECSHCKMAEIENLSIQRKSQKTYSYRLHHCHSIVAPTTRCYRRQEFQTHFLATFPLPTFVNLMKPISTFTLCTHITKISSSSLSVVTHPAELSLVFK